MELNAIKDLLYEELGNSRRGIIYRIKDVEEVKGTKGKVRAIYRVNHSPKGRVESETIREFKEKIAKEFKVPYESIPDQLEVRIAFKILKNREGKETGIEILSIEPACISKKELKETMGIYKKVFEEAKKRNVPIDKIIPVFNFDKKLETNILSTFSGIINAVLEALKGDFNAFNLTDSLFEQAVTQLTKKGACVVTNSNKKDGVKTFFYFKNDGTVGSFSICDLQPDKNCLKTSEFIGLMEEARETAHPSVYKELYQLYKKYGGVFAEVADWAKKLHYGEFSLQEIEEKTSPKVYRLLEKAYENWVSTRTLEWEDVAEIYGKGYTENQKYTFDGNVYGVQLSYVNKRKEITTYLDKLTRIGRWETYYETTPSYYKRGLMFLWNALKNDVSSYARPLVESAFHNWLSEYFVTFRTDLEDVAPRVGLDVDISIEKGKLIHYIFLSPPPFYLKEELKEWYEDFEKLMEKIETDYKGEKIHITCGDEPIDTVLKKVREHLNKSGRKHKP